MAVTAGYKADVYITGGAPVAFTNEATTANAARTQYTITNTARQHLARDVDVVVESSPDGVTWATVDPSEYTVQHAIGRIDFDTARAVGTSVRVDGAYLTASRLGGGRSWTLDVSVNIEDASEFGDGWRARQATIREGSASLERWWLDEAMLGVLTAGTSVVLVLYPNYAAGSRYVAYAAFTTDGVSTAVDGLVDESLDFDLDGEAHYVAA